MQGVVGQFVQGERELLVRGVGEHVRGCRGATGADCGSVTGARSGVVTEVLGCGLATSVCSV